MKIYPRNVARLHAKLGIFYGRHAEQKPTYVRKLLFSLAAYHFSKAYFLYFRKGNQIITSKVYEALIQTKFGKLDPALFDKTFLYSNHKKRQPSKLIRINWRRQPTKEEDKKRNAVA
jgi:hypothetical protein